MEVVSTSIMVAEVGAGDDGVPEVSVGGVGCGGGAWPSRGSGLLEVSLILEVLRRQCLDVGYRDLIVVVGVCWNVSARTEQKKD